MNIDLDQKFEYIRRIVSDNFGVDDMYRIKNKIYSLDEFIYYFERTNQELQGCWCQRTYLLY